MKNLFIILSIIALFSCKKKDEDVNPDTKDLSYRSILITVYKSDSTQLANLEHIIIYNNKQHYDDYMSGKTTIPGKIRSNSNPFLIENLPPAGTYYIVATDKRLISEKRDYYYEAKDWRVDINLYMPK